ncbi:MAG: hypothetical protein JJT89_07155 [Nitriliruptoraceae bacterium]|nr:hypothetical protein [Nitriliruptoraceae bacterium]
MSPDQDLPTQLIWATRGHSWGFRFLMDAGLPDPLPAYERAFADVGDEPTAWRRLVDTVALRFPDPEQRRDDVGRVIPHEFVVSGELAASVTSVEEGLRRIWPLVEATYARVWDAGGPPSATDLESTAG